VWRDLVDRKPVDKIRRNLLLGRNPLLTHFKVAIFGVPCDKLFEKRRAYHNPKRQRGICWRAAETTQVNPSLTFRVVMLAYAQLQN